MTTTEADREAWLSQHDMETLVKFHMQCDDPESGGYTAKADDISRLAELGVVRKIRGTYYETTAFGDYLCEMHWEQKPTLPLMTIATNVARSSMVLALRTGWTYLTLLSRPNPQQPRTFRRGNYGFFGCNDAMSVIFLISIFSAD